jgi:hypothetical protein
VKQESDHEHSPVVGDVAALAVLKALLGSSVVGTAGFFLAVFGVLQLVLGFRNWSRVVLAAAGATALDTVFKSIVSGDSPREIAALVILTAAVFLFTAVWVRREERPRFV